MSNDWLGKIQQGTQINFLAIPGTHDAASFTGVSSMPVLTITQQLNINEQLESGVRVLDMRVAHWWRDASRLRSAVPEDIYMCHGKVVFSLKLSEQLEIVKEFLSDNPTEFVAMIFQQQGTISANVTERKRVTDLIMKKITDVFSPEWIFRPKAGATMWPTVKQLKKKVMLFSRLEDPVDGAFDLTAWNTTSLDDIINARFPIRDTGLTVAVQDRYTQVTNTDYTDFLNRYNLWGLDNDVDEINHAKFILFDRLRSQFNEPYTLKINHLSHSLKDPEYTQPYMLGTDLNERLIDSITNKDARYRGFVMIDDADASVCKSIIDSNLIYRNDTRLVKRHKGRKR